MWLSYGSTTSNRALSELQKFPMGSAILGVDGTCDGLAHVFVNGTLVAIPNTNNTLMFLECKSIPTAGEDPIYYIYLRGRVDYAAAIGNITCTISPAQAAHMY